MQTHQTIQKEMLDYWIIFSPLLPALSPVHKSIILCYRLVALFLSLFSFSVPIQLCCEELIHAQTLVSKHRVYQDFCGGQCPCSVRSPQIPLAPSCPSPLAPSASDTQHLFFRECCGDSGRLSLGFRRHFPSKIDPRAFGAWFPCPILPLTVTDRCRSVEAQLPASGGTTLSCTFTPGFPCGVRLMDLTRLTL